MNFFLRFNSFKFETFYFFQRFNQRKEWFLSEFELKCVSRFCRNKGGRFLFWSGKVVSSSRALLLLSLENRYIEQNWRVGHCSGRVLKRKLGGKEENCCLSIYVMSNQISSFFLLSLSLFLSLYLNPRLINGKVIKS